jgi:hypothetical protein
MSTQESVAAPDSDKLDSGVYKVAAVVVLGAIMAILDTTVVNVALQALTIQFHTSFDTIQWVATGYMLALATVIPITGWASDRFGTKRLYLVAITLFLVGSMLAGLDQDGGPAARRPGDGGARRADAARPDRRPDPRRLARRRG